jgi:hypothetical protein
VAPGRTVLTDKAFWNIKVTSTRGMFHPDGTTTDQIVTSSFLPTAKNLENGEGMKQD